MIEIKVNGERVSIAEPMTVEQVLDTVDVPPNYLAVEVNATSCLERSTPRTSSVRGTSWSSLRWSVVADSTEANRRPIVGESLRDSKEMQPSCE